MTTLSTDEEKPVGINAMAAALGEERGKQTHVRLVRRAVNKGAPFILDPLTAKKMFLISAFIAWYRAQLVVRVSSAKTTAQRAGARTP